MFTRLTTTVFILISILTISWSASKQASKSNEPEVITESFNKTALILLVETSNNGIFMKLENRKLLKKCNKYYKGKSELAYKKEVDVKFKDKEVYRYYLSEEVIKTDFNSKGELRFTVAYFLFDRITEKKEGLNVINLREALEKLNTYLATK